MASRHKHFSVAGTFTIQKVRLLERVVVNAGAAGATVTVRFAGSNGTIATITAGDPDIGRVYNREFGGIGVDLEVVLSDATDVTVLYD